MPFDGNLYNCFVLYIYLTALNIDVTRNYAEPINFAAVLSLESINIWFKHYLVPHCRKLSHDLAYLSIIRVVVTFFPLHSRSVCSKFCQRRKLGQNVFDSPYNFLPNTTQY